MVEIIRIADYERRSKNPDSAQPRDPVDADVIILPVIRKFKPRELPGVFLTEGDNPYSFTVQPDDELPFPFGSYP